MSGDVSITKRTVIKLKLQKILYKHLDYSNLFNAIYNSNKLINIGYLFIRSFILYTIEKNTQYIPIINIDFIRITFNVISLESNKGRPYNDEKQQLINILSEYRDIFFKETSINYVDATNTSYILGQSYNQIYISIINNILYHYDKHIWAYIKAKYQKKYDSLEGKINERKELASKLGHIKDDLLNIGDPYYCVKSKRVFKTWFTKTFEKDVKANTFNYLKCMHNMNKFIQSIDKKSYQIFPIRTSGYQKYIKINTSALIEILSEDKFKYLKEAGNMDTQEYLWNKYFHLKHNNYYKCKRNGFSFNYELETDGYGVTLNFINNNEISNKERFKLVKKKGRDKINEFKKNAKNNEEYNRLKNEYHAQKDKIKDELKEKHKEDIKKKKEKFKKSSKDEQENIIYKINAKNEFPHIEKLTRNRVLMNKLKNDYEKGKIILCDPGKRSILYLMASNKVVHVPNKKLKYNNFGVSIWKDRKIMNYTNKTRLKFTKRLKYGKLIDSWKNKEKNSKKINYKIKSITNIINQLKKINHKKKNINHKNNILIKYFEKEKDILNEVLKVSPKTLKDLVCKNLNKFLLILIIININDLLTTRRENDLSSLNSKSCSHTEFIKYVKKKYIYDCKLNCQYNTNYLKKLNWFSYLNKRKHEDMLLNQIENEFGLFKNFIFKLIMIFNKNHY
jgi:hypothetical protein